MRNKDFNTDIRFTKLNVFAIPGVPTIQLLDGRVSCQGKHINLICGATVGNPADTTFNFYRNNQFFEGKSGTVNGNKTVATVVVTLISGMNLFRCQAINLAGSFGISGKVNVTAKEPPLITSCTNKTAVEGTKLIWTCTATGSQPLTTSWLKENNNNVISSNNAFSIASVKRTDAGKYRFTVSNGDECPTASTTIYLTVQYSPQVTNPQGQDCKSLTVNENQDVTLFCDASGEPKPTITWTKDGVPLSKQGSPLVLQNVVRNQTGNYTCTADNGIGKADTACWKLDVQYIQDNERCGKTYQISTGQCLPVHPDGNPFPSVSCSSKVNVLVNHHGKTFNICGNKEKTNSTCTISNAVGGCSIKLKVQKQTAPVNKVWVVSYRIINLEWNALLKNEFSEEFNTLKSQNDQMLKLVYAHQFFVTSIIVTDFREGRTGSVIVNYLLILNAHVADPSLPLKEALNVNSSGGTLGGLKIDPISIQAGPCSKNEPQSTESCSCPSLGAFIAGYVLMSIFALIIVAGFIYCKRKGRYR